jgi:hypothetical protein
MPVTTEYNKKCPFLFVQSVQWFCQYFLIHSRSEMSNEHRSDSRQLRSYEYLKFKVTWALRKTTGPFMRLAASKIRWCKLFSSVYFAFIRNVYHVIKETVGEWGPVTVVANSADHHDQSIGQATAHSGTPSGVHWNVGLPVTLGVHL